MNILKIASLGVAAVVSAAFGTGVANATTLYFSFAGSGYSGVGSFVTTGSSSPYTVTDITGTASDPLYNSGAASDITGISTFWGPDNLLSFPDRPFEDFAGIAFSTLDGNKYNLYSNGGDYIASLNNQNFGYSIVFKVSTNPLPSLLTPAVPEPTTWAMMFIGIGLIGATARRRPEPRVLYA